MQLQLEQLPRKKLGVSLRGPVLSCPDVLSGFRPACHACEYRGTGDHSQESMSSQAGRLLPYGMLCDRRANALLATTDLLHADDDLPAGMPFSQIPQCFGSLSRSG